MDKNVQEQLWIACETGDVASIRMSVIEGADVDARDAQERTALNIASQYGHVEAYKTLMAARAMARLERLKLPLFPSAKSKTQDTRRQSTGA